MVSAVPGPGAGQGRARAGPLLQRHLHSFRQLWPQVLGVPPPPPSFTLGLQGSVPHLLAIPWGLQSVFFNHALSEKTTSIYAPSSKALTLFPQVCADPQPGL